MNLDQRMNMKKFPLCLTLLSTILFLTACSVVQPTAESADEVNVNQNTAVQVGWTELQSNPNFKAQRQGRFFKVALNQPHRVISTSAYNGGETTSAKYLVNHQSMEARGDMRWAN